MEKIIKFGTDGWRAKMSEDFTVENVTRVVRAIASYLRDEKEWQRGIFIGYDTRRNSEVFAERAAEVMAEYEIPVWLASDFMPTPLTAFAVIKKELAGAIMFTASHNPPDYNGIKFIPEYGGPAFPEITSAIEQRIVSRDTRISIACPTILDYYDPLEDYLDHLSSIIDFDLIREAKLKIVLDPMHGAGIRVFKEIFGKCAGEIINLHDHRDTSFGGSFPDPSEPHLTELKNTMLTNGYDLGLALDGDADRSGLFDSTGAYIGANQALALIADYLIGKKGMPGKLVRTIATTHLLDGIAAAHGRELVETPVGFKYIAREMLLGEVVTGGEESGGLSTGSHLPEKDGVFANLLLTEITASYGKPLTEVLKGIYEKYGSFYNRRIDIALDVSGKQRLMDMFRESPPDSVNGTEVKDVSTLDGVRLTLSNKDWILIRPSGTEELVRIYLEAGESDRLAAYQEYFRQLISNH